jgi:hypothetical protein
MGQQVLLVVVLMAAHLTASMLQVTWGLLTVLLLLLLLLLVLVPVLLLLLPLLVASVHLSLPVMCGEPWQITWSALQVGTAAAAGTEV